MTRRRSQGPVVLLPWEQRRAWFAELVVGRRWRGALGIAAVVFALVAVWRFAGHRARVRVTRATIAEVQRAMELFRTEVGRCPRSVVELVHPPRAGAGYLVEVPMDAWGRPLYVRCPGDRPGDAGVVVSAGPSGSFSIEDSVM